ncbi:MAG: YbhB/YbcL family Raf kinase inhibitor-like protein [Candidatus Promineifilaceae bacterium]|nr:YbhB/YbcL family Raf kinase inhibitor-like protein [Candidatus Promineifilaceae bacterium]
MTLKANRLLARSPLPLPLPWVALLALLVTVGCGQAEAPARSEASAASSDSAVETEESSAAADSESEGEGDVTGGEPFNLQSAAFASGEAIPTQYTCDGADISPPLDWRAPAADVQSYALIMDDPDAEPVAGFVWVHWLLFNIPASVDSLPEDLPAEAELADGSRHGETSFGSLGYGGPCPPGGTHEYRFRLYALDITLDLQPGADKDTLLEAMDGHIVAETEVTATYTRQ